MQGHDRNLLLGVFAFIVHDQADVFQKPLKIVKTFKGFHQFLEVFKTAGRFGGFVVLPHGRVAGFIQDHLR